MFTCQKHYFHLLLVTGAILMSQSNMAWCAPPPPPVSTASPIVPIAPSVKTLQISELEGDAALQAKVSFTAKSQPLQELLAELQKQTKIVLLPIPAVPTPAVRVTAYIQALPLSQVMLGLSRLYGVRWMKTADNSFTMLPSDKSAFELGLMQLGDVEGFTSRFLASQRQSPEHMDWPQEITKYVNEQDLRNGATPQVSVLPAELLSKIRKEKEQMAALRLIEMYQAAMEASIDDYILRAEVPKTITTPDGKTVSPPPRILVRTTEGKGIASFTPPPPLPTLTPRKDNKNQPTRNIPGRT